MSVLVPARRSAAFRRRLRTRASRLTIGAGGLALLLVAGGPTLAEPTLAELALAKPALSGIPADPVVRMSHPDHPANDRPVILVTGSTDGLGREVARRLASSGVHVIVHGRNAERGLELVREIEAEGIGSATFHAADFGDLDQVRALARAVIREHDRLDALVNNAGIWLEADAGRVLSADGHELHFQVNYLSSFLLTRMLLPLLLETAMATGDARIVNVASGAQTPLDFENAMLAAGYTDGRAYGQSKLAQILFTVDLAEELEGSGVRALTLHPATFMDTNMVLGRGADPRSSVDEGTAAVLRLILDGEVESGQYYNGVNPQRANAQAYDPADRAKLRRLSLELVGLAPAPGAWTRSDPGASPFERVPRDQVADLCGLDPALLDQADRTLADTPFAVVRYGRLCWESGATEEPYHVFSITKTMGSLLFGIVASRSSLSDEDPIARWLETEELGDIHPDARIAHILSMTATRPDLAWGAKGEWAYDASGNREINRLTTVMNRAIAAEPRNFSGISDVCDLARLELFEPLGMQGTDWCSDLIGYTMNSTVRDMARMGLLILQGGVYGGRPLLDAEYVYRMSHPAFPDTNTGYGYLLYNNALENWGYSTGVNDPVGAPFGLWPEYPHRPFHEAEHCNGGAPDCRMGYDVGINWASGAGGQRIVIHRGLDLVMVIRDDASNNGHTNVWNAVRPALVALDATFEGDEAAFTEAYAAGRYAPDLPGVIDARRREP